MSLHVLQGGKKHGRGMYAWGPVIASHVVSKVYADQRVFKGDWVEDTLDGAWNPGQETFHHFFMSNEVEHPMPEPQAEASAVAEEEMVEETVIASAPESDPPAEAAGEVQGEAAEAEPVPPTEPLVAEAFPAEASTTAPAEPAVEGEALETAAEVDPPSEPAAEAEAPAEQSAQAEESTHEGAPKGSE